MSRHSQDPDPDAHERYGEYHKTLTSEQYDQQAPAQEEQQSRAQEDKHPLMSAPYIQPTYFWPSRATHDARPILRSSYPDPESLGVTQPYRTQSSQISNPEPPRNAADRAVDHPLQFNSTIGQGYINSQDYAEGTAHPFNKSTTAYRMQSQELLEPHYFEERNLEGGSVPIDPSLLSIQDPALSMVNPHWAGVGQSSGDENWLGYNEASEDQTQINHQGHMTSAHPSAGLGGYIGDHDMNPSASYIGDQDGHFPQNYHWGGPVQVAGQVNSPIAEASESPSFESSQPLQYTFEEVLTSAPAAGNPRKPVGHHYGLPVYEFNIKKGYLADEKDQIQRYDSRHTQPSYLLGQPQISEAELTLIRPGYGQGSHHRMEKFENAAPGTRHAVRCSDTEIDRLNALPAFQRSLTGKGKAPRNYVQDLKKFTGAMIAQKEDNSRLHDLKVVWMSSGSTGTFDQKKSRTQVARERAERKANTDPNVWAAHYQDRLHDGMTPAQHLAEERNRYAAWKKTAEGQLFIKWNDIKEAVYMKAHFENVAAQAVEKQLPTAGQKVGRTKLERHQRTRAKAESKRSHDEYVESQRTMHDERHSQAPEAQYQLFGQPADLTPFQFVPPSHAQPQGNIQASQASASTDVQTYQTSPALAARSPQAYTFQYPLIQPYPAFPGEASQSPPAQIEVSTEAPAPKRSRNQTLSTTSASPEPDHEYAAMPQSVNEVRILTTYANTVPVADRSMWNVVEIEEEYNERNNRGEFYE